jgi:hypothetical protein
MEEYQLTLRGISILRKSDGVYIPLDPANTDYQAYLKFLAEGGQPLPADSE